MTAVCKLLMSTGSKTSDGGGESSVGNDDVVACVGLHGPAAFIAAGMGGPARPTRWTANVADDLGEL